MCLIARKAYCVLLAMYGVATVINRAYYEPVAPQGILELISIPLYHFLLTLTLTVLTINVLENYMLLCGKLVVSIITFSPWASRAHHAPPPNSPGPIFLVPWTL